MRTTLNHNVLIIVLSLAFYFSNAQDTIVKKNYEKLLVRVIEISDSIVSYKVFYNPDGKIYELPNQSVLSVIYENGIIEPKFIDLRKKEQKIILEDKHLSYQGEDISHTKAFRLMLRKDPHQNSDDLNNYLTNAEINKNRQMFFTILSPVSFIGGAYLARRNYYGPHTADVAGAYLISGASVALISGVTAIIIKRIKNKQIRSAVILYNQEL